MENTKHELERQILKRKFNYYINEQQELGNNYPQLFKQLLTTYYNYKEEIYRTIEERNRYYYSYLVMNFFMIDIIDGKLQVEEEAVEKTFNKMNFKPLQINNTSYNIGSKFLYYTFEDALKEDLSDEISQEAFDIAQFKKLTIKIANTLNGKIIKEDVFVMIGKIRNFGGNINFTSSTFDINEGEEECIGLTGYLFKDIIERVCGDYCYDIYNDITYRLANNVIKGITYLNNKKDKLTQGVSLIAGLKTVAGFNGDNPGARSLEDYLKTIEGENNHLFWDCYKYVFTTFDSFINTLIKFHYIITVINRRNNSPQYTEAEEKAIETIGKMIRSIVNTADENLGIDNINELLTVYDTKFELADKQWFILEVFLKYMGNMNDGYNEDFVKQLNSLMKTLIDYNNIKTNITLTIDNLKNIHWLKEYWDIDVAILPDDEERIEELTKEDILDED